MSKIWSYNSDKDICELARPIAIKKSGVKTTYELRTANHSIRATATHQFLTLSSEHWMPLQKIRPGDYIAVLGKEISKSRNEPKHPKGDQSWRYGKRKTYDGRSTEFAESKLEIITENGYICQAKNCNSLYEEAHHIDGDYTNNCKQNIALLCRKHHKRAHIKMGEPAPYPHMHGKEVVFEKVLFIGNPYEEETYDIEMGGNYFSFEANGIIAHNSWGMNRSHTISYSIISYWCAYMKAHHILEFAVASLNNSKDDVTALKLLRDLKENEGIEYVVLDPKVSEKKWSVHNGKLYGGLCTINGVGPAKANQIIESRKTGKALSPGLAGKLVPPIDSPFQYLYPAREKYGDYYTDSAKYGISRKVKTIDKVAKNGDHVIIGNLIHKNVRDANEIVNVAKRGGNYLTGPTSWLNLTIEDDTDLIICTIGRHDYEAIGKEIAETGKENKDWYLIHGTMKNNWRKLYVKNIRRITR